MIKKQPLYLSFLSIALVGLLTTTLHGQEVYEGTQDGTPIFGSFQGSNLDQVSLSNGNLHIEIPILTVQQRGRAFTYQFVYDTQSWAVSCEEGQTPEEPACRWFVDPEFGAANFRLVDSLSFWWSNTPVTKVCPGFGPYVVRKWAVEAPDGTSHAMANKTSSMQGCEASLLTGPSLDGAGIWMEVSGSFPGQVTKILLKDGTQVLPNFRDSNGNLASPTADMLNRNLLVSTNGPTIVYTAPFGGTITGPQFTTWTVKDPNGISRDFRLDYEAVNLHTSACGAPYSPPTQPCTEQIGVVLRVNKLTLPDLTFYRFTYAQNSFAELTRLDLPTGGFIEYTYGNLYFKPPDTNAFATHHARRGVLTRRVNGTALWTYSYPVGTNNIGKVTDPANNDEEGTFVYLSSGTGQTAGSRVETERRRYQGTGAGRTLLQTVQKEYDFEGAGMNARVKRETTILETGQTSKVETDYEMFTYAVTGTATRLNVTERREFDFGPVLARRTVFTYKHTGNQPYLDRNIVDRMASVQVFDGAGALQAHTVNEYDNYTLGIAGTSGIQHDDVGYPPSFTIRGNLTAVQNWLNPGGTWLETRYQYDELGNILSVKDPGGHTISYSYNDNFSDGINRNGLAYVTQTTYPQTGSVTHVESRRYFFSTAQLERLTDRNNQHTTFTYDGVSRPLQTNFPDGGLQTLCYSHDPNGLCFAAGEFATRMTIKHDATKNIVSKTVLDELGRVKQTQLTDPDCTTGPVKVDVTYDALGRKATQSNPYCPGDTIHLTKFTYDALGRGKSVVPPDGTLAPDGTCTNCTQTSFSGNTVTVTDEAGKKSKSETDALGRLIRVWEPNSAQSLVHLTRYFYNGRGDLECVLQLSTDAEPLNCNSPNAVWRPRKFTYDSLSRLLTADNPESGLITYTYDNDSSLLTRVAPKPNQTGSLTVTTTYSHDVHHRLTQKSYSDGTTPPAKFGYDGIAPAGCTPPTLTITHAIGRRTAMCDAGGSQAWSYDSVGRVLIDRRQMTGVASPKDVQQTYNFDGSVKSVTFPSARVVNYLYNEAGRPLSAKDPARSSFYAIEASYFPNGALRTVKNGKVPGGQPGITTDNAFNSRLQPSLLSASSPTQTLLSLTYIFDQDPGANVVNNGNVVKIINNRANARNQSFTYDHLNRLLSAQTPDSNLWGTNFTYDIWGNLTNMTVIPGKIDSQNLQAAPANSKNQLPGYGYDAAGNLTQNGSIAYTYDAENRIVSVGGTINYTYDGDGRRVKKSNGKLYWYGIDGNVLAESDLTGTLLQEYIFFNGRRTAYRKVVDNAVWYYFSDHLGSNNVMANADGSSIPEESDFYPYGGEREVLNGHSNSYKFTGKERDGESLLDYFGARHYASNMGRFMSPDPSGLLAQKPAYPQSWNLYSYVLNNPLVNIDPNGLDCIYASTAGDSDVASIDHESDADACGDSGGTWVPGYVDENWVQYNDETGLFQVGSFDGAGDNATVGYTMFAAGAQTDADGNCLSGCGGFDSGTANANWLQGMLVGNSMAGGLDGMIQFMIGRMEPIHGILGQSSPGLGMQLISGGINNNWGGPAGMGVPQSQADWAFMVHDHNFGTNDIKIGTYFNPFISRETANALIQSNNTLIRNAGGIQSVKTGLFFKVVNAFQRLFHPF